MGDKGVKFELNRPKTRSLRPPCPTESESISETTAMSNLRTRHRLEPISIRTTATPSDAKPTTSGTDKNAKLHSAKYIASNYLWEG